MLGFQWQSRAPTTHVVLGNDSTVLVMQENPFLHRKAPYIGFSPLSLPFRPEGVGLIENVRAIDKALSQIANLSVDTLMFRLLPLFEVAVEAFENSEDLETGFTPGKILRKKRRSQTAEKIRQCYDQALGNDVRVGLRGTRFSSRR